MTFFVTSVGSGDGANLGGLDGADAHCMKLAEAAGSTGKTWKAYLSAEGTNAKDRIGAGPWQNFKGDVIATDVANLHSADNKLTKATALSETGMPINGRGDDPNQHDILTGSNPDGTVVCHKGEEIGVAFSAVSHHLSHGDFLGPCSVTAAAAASVLVCHAPDGNAHEIEIGFSAVSHHLSHGDFLGPCEPISE